VVARVQIQHEVDQRSLEACAQTGQTREARAGDLRRALEVENAKCGPELPVRPRLEVERSRLAVAPHLDVVRRARAGWHAFMRQIGQH
jgi:hypothetical protein